MYTGSTNAMEWIATDFNLDNWLSEDSNDGIGWKTLEVVHIAIRGTLLWVGAIEWLFLAGIFGLLYISVRTQQYRVFGMRWATFGAVLACLCIIGFAFELLRFASWKTFTKASGIITFINRVVLFPFWLYWLSIQLPKAHEGPVRREASDDIEVVGRHDVSSSTTPLKSGRQESDGTFRNVV
jgi:hypothetical protein